MLHFLVFWPKRISQIFSYQLRQAWFTHTFTHLHTHTFSPLPSYPFGCLPCSELGQWLHVTFYGLHNKKEQSICHSVKCRPWGFWQSCVWNIVMTFDIAEKATVYWGKILMARNGNGQHFVLCYFTWIMCLAVTIESNPGQKLTKGLLPGSFKTLRKMSLTFILMMKKNVRLN